MDNLYDRFSIVEMGTNLHGKVAGWSEVERNGDNNGSAFSRPVITLPIAPSLAIS